MKVLQFCSVPCPSSKVVTVGLCSSQNAMPHNKPHSKYLLGRINPGGQLPLGREAITNGTGHRSYIVLGGVLELFHGGLELVGFCSLILGQTWGFVGFQSPTLESNQGQGVFSLVLFTLQGPEMRRHYLEVVFLLARPERGDGPRLISGRIQGLVLNVQDLHGSGREAGKYSEQAACRLPWM